MSAEPEDKVIDDEMLIEAVRNTVPLWNHSKTRMPVQTKDLWNSVCVNEQGCSISLDQFEGKVHESKKDFNDLYKKWQCCQEKE